MPNYFFCITIIITFAKIFLFINHLKKFRVMKISRKSTVTTLCAVMIGLFFAVGCKKDDPKGPIEGTGDVDYPIEIPFTEYSLAASCQWANLAYDNTVIIINSYEELQQYVVCPNKGTSEIDFSKQTLLLANGTATGGISEITVTSLQQLAPNEYALELEILLDDSAVDEERWTIALIVEKVSEEGTVELKFTEYPIEIPFTEYFVHWGGISDFQCWKNLNHPYNPDFVFFVRKISIINDNKDLANYLICPEDYPAIDFSRHTLVLVSYISTNTISGIRDIVFLKIGTNQYTMKAAIRQAITDSSDDWCIAILTPKLEDGASVTFISI